MKKSFNVNSSAWKSVFLGVTATGAEKEEERAESVNKDSYVFLLTVFGIMVVGVAK